MITGVTLVRNANQLRYPWKLMLRSLLNTCDKVIVNCDPTDDNTFEELKLIAGYHPKIKIFLSRWDMSNTGNGSMLATEVNKVLPQVDTEWILYLQADELVHEDDAEYYRNLTATAPPNITQIEMLRSYFWGRLNQRYTPNEIYLGRLFRLGTHIVGGDGMHLIRLMGDVYRSNKMIYHYSRMGTEEQITERIRNLDRLFHDEKEIALMKPFSYNDVPPNDVMIWEGSHPSSVRDLYEGK